MGEGDTCASAGEARINRARTKRMPDIPYNAAFSLDFFMIRSVITGDHGSDSLICKHLEKEIMSDIPVDDMPEGHPPGNSPYN
jgi:hypothetical protein